MSSSPIITLSTPDGLTIPGILQEIKKKATSLDLECLSTEKIAEIEHLCQEALEKTSHQKPASKHLFSPLGHLRITKKGAIRLLSAAIGTSSAAWQILIDTEVITSQVNRGIAAGFFLFSVVWMLAFKSDPIAEEIQRILEEIRREISLQLTTLIQIRKEIEQTSVEECCQILYLYRRLTRKYEKIAEEIPPLENNEYYLSHLLKKLSPNHPWRSPLEKARRQQEVARSRKIKGDETLNRLESTLGLKLHYLELDETQFIRTEVGASLLTLNQRLTTPGMAEQLQAQAKEIDIHSTNFARIERIEGLATAILKQEREARETKPCFRLHRIKITRKNLWRAISLIIGINASFWQIGLDTGFVTSTTAHWITLFSLLLALGWFLFFTDEEPNKGTSKLLESEQSQFLHDYKNILEQETTDEQAIQECCRQLQNYRLLEKRYPSALSHAPLSKNNSFYLSTMFDKLPRTHPWHQSLQKTLHAKSEPSSPLDRGERRALVDKPSHVIADDALEAISAHLGGFKIDSLEVDGATFCHSDQKLTQRERS